MKIIAKVKFPKLPKRLKKDDEPVLIFYRKCAQAAKLSLRSGFVYNVQAFSVSPSDHDLFMEYLIAFLKKSQPERKFRVQSDAAFMDLMYGPRVREDVPVGEVHIEQDWQIFLDGQ